MNDDLERCECGAALQWDPNERGTTCGGLESTHGETGGTQP